MQRISEVELKLFALKYLKGAREFKVVTELISIWKKEIACCHMFKRHTL